MKSKKGNSLKKLQKQVNELGLDLQAIYDEYKLYLPPDKKHASDPEWFEHLPIETLSESINRDKGLPRSYYSLRDLDQSENLKRFYLEKLEEFEQLNQKLKLAKINKALKDIKKLEINI